MFRLVSMSLTAIVGVHFWGVSLVSASEVPVTAHNRALGVSRLILDHPEQGFLHPSRWGEFRPALRGFNVGFGPGFSLHAGSAKHSIVVTSRTRDTFGLFASRGSDSRRFGIGFEAFRDSENSEFSRVTDTLRESTEAFLETSLGVSLGKRPLRAHASIGARFPKNETSRTLRERDIARSSVYKQNEPVQLHGALHLVRKVSRHGKLHVAARFADRTEEWVVRNDDLDSDLKGEHYGHDWKFACGYETPTEHLHRFLLSFEASQQREPRSSSLDTEDSRASTLTSYQLASGAEAPLFVRDLQGLIGLKWTYDDRDDLRITKSGRFDTNDQSLVASFQWGLAYGWRRLRLVGVLDSDLQLAEPFVSVDVELSL